MEEKKQDKKIEIDQEYNKITNKFFHASLMNIPIFGIPAFIALFLGKFLDKKLDTDKFITIGLLFVALASSWIIVIKNNKRLTRELRQYREGKK